jgi:hypothetical protein
MDEKIRKELENGKLSPLHNALLQHAKSLVEMSRGKMNGFYDMWDQFDDIYRGKRFPDKTDLEQRKKDLPEKMVVPLAYAQVQTFVAFCIMLYTQKDTIVELQAQGPEDEQPAKLGEALIDRDLNENCFVALLKQYLTDISRFGIGILKHTWVKETQMVREQTVFAGSAVVAATEPVQKTKFLGNRIVNISPYRWFPDPRLPLGRLQEGEFCADEDEVSIIELERQQHDGLVAGIKNIPEWNYAELTAREGRSRLFSQQADTELKNKGQSKGMCVRTEVQVWLTPKDFLDSDGDPMGPEDYPVLYVITYANDQTVIRCEPMNYVHNEFTYDCAEFNPDMHHLVNTSLSEIIDLLQSTISWFINSHITSVRRIIQNRIVYDPSAIEDEDLKKDTPHIRMNSAAYGGDVRRFLFQLQLQDVTTGHINDVEVLKQIMMEVTSISENGLGQYATGRRSAEEARNVNFNAASRMKIVATIIYYTGLAPLFRKMLSNLRDGLDEETYVKVRGLSSDPNEFAGFKVTRDDLVGDYDFKVFDATLPSEKSRTASLLGEMLQEMMSNPQAIPMFGYDPRKLFDRMFELLGVKNLNSLKLDPIAQQQMMVAMQMMQGGQPTNANPTQGAPAQVQPAGAGAVSPGAAGEPNLQGALMFG